MGQKVEIGWKELITKALKETPEGKPKISAGFNPPASADLLSKAQSELEHSFPDELSDLLLFSNGIRQQMEVSGSDIGIGYLIWPIERISDENSRMRSREAIKEAYMSFDDLLFFSDAGNGDLFGFSVQEGKVSKSDIYVWNHEDDSRTWVSPSLKTFIEWWTSGKIAV